MEQVKYDLPVRPKRQQNKNLRKISLLTNMFKFQLQKDFNIYQYQVQIEPEIPADSRSLAQKIFASGIKEIKKTFNNKIAAHRGNHFYSDVKIDEIFTITTEFGKKEYTIRISYQRSINLEDISITDGTGNEITMVLNVQLKNIMKEKLKFIEIDKNSKFYDLTQTRNIKQFDLQVWTGLKTSMILAQDSAYTLVDFSSRVLRFQTALDMFYDLCDKYKGNEQKAADEMQGLSVLSAYGNQRIYRITEIDLKKKPTDKFTGSDGKAITFLDYFKNTYNVKIKDKDQPLIRFHDRKQERDIYLIPELMRMTGLTDRQRGDFKLMQELAKYTKLNAEERYNFIEKPANQIRNELKKVGFNLDTNNPEINGFELKPPTIRMGKNQAQVKFGNFQLRQTQVQSPGDIKEWGIIYQSRGQQDDKEIDDFVADLQKASKAFGIRISEPVVYLTPNSNRSNDWINELKGEFNKNGPVDILVSYISRKEQNTLYSPLKEFLYGQQGIPHQNVLKESLRKNRMSVLSNILLQMNSKLNNPNWIVDRPPQISGDKIMLVGVDLYHKLINKNQSCLGFVASINKEFSQYFSKICIKKQGEDTIHELGLLFKDAINEYFNINGEFPEKIVVYRDGVAEGQLQRAIDQEIASVRKCFDQIKDGYTPQLAYIFINKKINQRFFAPDQRSDKLQNPASGTVVADGITSKQFDFYLAAQSVRQGTCTPTHYVVGFNSIQGWTEEVFWLLTYYQCFNYYNWQGAVKVPAPVQYAHKLSYLVGETFKKNPHGDLHDCLYYL